MIILLLGFIMTFRPKWIFIFMSFVPRSSMMNCWPNLTHLGEVSSPTHMLLWLPYSDHRVLQHIRGWDLCTFSHFSLLHILCFFLNRFHVQWFQILDYHRVRKFYFDSLSLQLLYRFHMIIRLFFKLLFFSSIGIRAG